MRMFHTVSARENIPIMVVQDIMGNFCLVPTATVTGTDIGNHLHAGAGWRTSVGSRNELGDPGFEWSLNL